MVSDQRPYVTLHSLNSLRVCAEFCVIHFHVAQGENGFLQNEHLANALMSFFFVLSGFMAMYTNTQTDFSNTGAKLDYIGRRMKKVFPMYLIWWTLDMPVGLIRSWNLADNCSLFLVSVMSQPVLLHSWLGGIRIGIVNIACWYLCTLIWLWCFFPFLCVKECLEHWPWMKMLTLYLSSILCFASLSGFHAMDVKILPIMRLSEFLMGCCIVFTLNKPVHRLWLLVSMLVFLAFSIITYVYSYLWIESPSPVVCQLWQRQEQIMYSPRIFPSMCSILFCIPVQWLAATELRGDAGLTWLHWDFFKSLSSFSLHVYLSHVVVTNYLRSVFDLFGILHWWSSSTLILTCYLTAYQFSILEPKIMRHMRASYDMLMQSFFLGPDKSCETPEKRELMMDHLEVQA
jgi:peptidoglycan/LPS O-acetylase OafA/YrhL